MSFNESGGTEVITNLLGVITSFMSSSIGFMKLDVPKFVVYMFIVIMPSQWIVSDKYNVTFFVASY